jgi:hypothetical protein
VPTSRTRFPFSLAGKANAEPIIPEPIMVMVFIGKTPFLGLWFHYINTQPKMQEKPVTAEMTKNGLDFCKNAVIN